MDSTPAPVFHHAPRPVSVNEFRDAIHATCRPLFPMVRWARHRKLALAISGGVDSMALAFLTASLAKMYGILHVADNPIARSGIYGLVVDHQLRDGSGREASAVLRELAKMDIRPAPCVLHWKQERRLGLDPSQLPNVESLARTKRYQALGTRCLQLRATSILFAHHRDDHYETVLMRLLGGHGYRGLQGIRDANAIPECYELHGVYKSGLLDDQRAKDPYLSFKPSNKVMRSVRSAFKYEGQGDYWSTLKSYLDTSQAEPQFPGHINRAPHPHAPYLTPLNSEDGGITVYRPLLDFDKDRLRATCEANNIKWFEDHTNHDPTLTTRNAVRHLVRTHELPRALQKPAILALSNRAKRRVTLEEEEARRLLVREAVIKDFDPNVGTLLVDLPTFSPKKSQQKGRFASARHQARIPRRRLIAAVAVRKLIDFVTPDRHLPPLANLSNVVDRLFPELSSDPPSPPKAFAIAGVMFDPVQSSTSTQWFLSRAPYTSNQPLPTRVSPSQENWQLGALDKEPVPAVHSRPAKTLIFKVWDGRYWLRLTTRVPARFSVQPLLPELLKPFRLALGPARRRRLEALLKYYAPGKVRYALPALYNEEYSQDANAPNTLTLLALPSLGIHVPGLERWVKYDVRYKKVDVSLLGRRRKGEEASWLSCQPACTASRKLRLKRLARHLRRRYVQQV